MKTYVVFYNKDISACYTRVPFEKQEFERIAEVQAEDLEDLFRKMNVVDGTELPLELRVRSMSCGDVAKDAETQEMYYCDIAGWKKL